MADTFQESLWHATAEPAPELPCWTEDVSADIAVVGAGYLGLASALNLAESGARVVVLEAEEVGHGASGRNTGFVVPSFVTGLGPREVKALLGPAHGERLCDLVGRSGDRVFELINKYDIRCDAKQSGWLQPAHSAERVGFLEQRRADWLQHGKTMQLLDRGTTVRLTGAPGYHGALLDKSGGHLNPLSYARGLARAAVGAGATIRTGARVTELHRDGQAWTLRMPAGQVRADKVLLATNALDADLAPRVARSMVPLVVHQIAAKVSDPASRQTILPENHCVSDTRRDIFAYRWTPDGRLVTGGAAAWAPGATGRLRRSLADRLRRLLPSLGPLTVDFAWSGIIGLTRDRLPRVFEVESGLFAALGCNGRGLALSTALGSELAAFLRGDERGLSVPVSRPAPMRGHLVARHLPSILLPWARLTDRLETGPALDRKPPRRAGTDNEKGSLQ